MIDNLVNSTKNAVGDVAENNASSIKDAAIRSVANSINKAVTENILKVIPENMSSKINESTGRVIVANVLHEVISRMFPKSALAQSLSKEFLTTSYQDITDSVVENGVKQVKEKLGGTDE